MAFTPTPAEPVPPAQPDQTPESLSAVAGALNELPDQGPEDALSTGELIEQLQADRLWLLRQIDAGAYPELRLDLAALERELGQVLDQASERSAA
jgi:hypothetical protein